MLSADRRRTVVQLGVGTAVGGDGARRRLGIARSAVIDHVDGPEARAAVGAVWDAFLGDLHTAGWILAGAGAVVAAAAASLIRPVDIDAPLRRAAAWVTTEPTRPRDEGRCAASPSSRSGCSSSLDHDAVLQLLFTAAGLYLIYAGVSAVLWLVYQPRAEQANASRGAGVRGRRRTVVAGLVAAVLIVGAAGAFVGSGGTTTAAPAAGPCNGARRALRPLARPGGAGRRRTTRCRSRCPAGSPPSRTGRSPTSCATASAAC